MEDGEEHVASRNGKVGRLKAIPAVLQGQLFTRWQVLLHDRKHVTLSKSNS